MDQGSGAVHVVDDVVYDVLPHVSNDIETIRADGSGQRYDAKNRIEQAVLADFALRKTHEVSAIRGALTDIFELIRDGSLFADDVYEPFIDAFSKRQTVVKALCLNVAHDCNLRCRYCFADEGEYHGKRELMSEETGKAALDFLVRESGNRKNLEVDFFGGEPLMNFDVVKAVVAYGRELERTRGKRFRFTLTTNGVLLNDGILDFVNREMSNLVLSIDGRKAVHDRMRPFTGGHGSYDAVLPKLLRAAESRKQTDYFVRGTFTRYNLDFAEDVIHLAELGFEQISVEPVVASPEDDYALRMEDVPALEEQYDRLAVYLLKRHREGRPVSFFHFNIDLEGGPCVYKRLSGCGAGSEYLGVTPQGKLYPCHQFVGKEDFTVGDIRNGINRTDLTDRFKACNVYTRDACRDCFARLYCAGGCAANAYNFTGGLNGVYDVGCALQKKRIECALMLKAALSEPSEYEIRKEEAL